MPAPGPGFGHEDRTRLGQPVTELGVLAEPQFGVEPAGLGVEAARQCGGGADVRPEVQVVAAPELVGVGDQAFDVLVRLGVVEPEEPVDGAGRAALGDLFRGGPAGVHEALVAEGHHLVADVLPAGLRGHVLGEDDHVGVEPVQDLAVAARRADVQRGRPAPAVTVVGDPEQPAVVGTDRGQDQRRVAAVVDHHHLQQPRRVRLGAQRGQGEVE
ncbi:hypothetical protein GCM10027615_07370 [Plantactinospora veratri]